MSIRPPRSSATEHVFSALSGWPMLIVNLLLFAAAAYVIGFGTAPESAVKLVGVALALLGLLMLGGYFTLQPNQARVLILFGAYKGTVRESGFHWANPFYSRTRGRDPTKHAAADEGGARIRLRSGSKGELGLAFLPTKLSLRAHNFSSDAIKVNDKRGNPVEIAAVVVWRVENTAQAVFDVEDYSSYVEIQSESAIRSIASRYAYDQGEEHEITLRGGADEVALALKEELQVRLAKAGVIVEDARLTHLAYAPEIAPVMLRRQQAEAIIAARKIIVQNAVTMVQMALDDLDRRNVVKLDDERKAAMVSNLLVVLCGNSDASPVINTGTLYT
ncbi:MAG TPA: SPFH domain-containing protein [Steroidobacteraceae bacterium]|jgi:regulator of protease activity HflC (stomatin/prohibitin superfamily)|nr:SPFH domain-containing protein [Steroidobacteraceae bacterium]